MRLRDCVTCIPHRTLAVLPPDGIVIQLTVARERPLPQLALANVQLRGLR